MYGDSVLVIYQLNGEWETKDEKLVSYHKIIMKMIEQFEKVSFEHFPWEENYLVDALAILATVFKVNANIKAQIVKLEVRKSLVHYACVEKEPDGNPWYYDILQYLKG